MRACCAAASAARQCMGGRGRRFSACCRRPRSLIARARVPWRRMDGWSVARRRVAWRIGGLLRAVGAIYFIRVAERRDNGNRNVWEAAAAPGHAASLSTHRTRAQARGTHTHTHDSMRCPGPTRAIASVSSTHRFAWRARPAPCRCRLSHTTTGRAQARGSTHRDTHNVMPGPTRAIGFSPSVRASVTTLSLQQGSRGAAIFFTSLAAISLRRLSS